MTISRSLWYSIAALAMAGCWSVSAARDLPAPSIFAPAIVTDADSAPTFSASGKTLLYARNGATSDTIFESHFANGAWSAPVVASFSGKWNDLDPVFSPDGSYAIFSSVRPIDGRAQTEPQFWRVDRTQNGWGTPTPLPATVNDGAFLVAPSIASDGTLYFLHIAKNHAHQLYRARFEDGTYVQAEPLAFSVPSARDYDPSTAPDQSYVIFASSGRDATHGKKRHLFIVFAQGSTWGRAMPIHYAGETASDDAGPILGRDGKTVYFVSDRNGGSNAWTLDAGSLLKAKQ